MNKISVFGSSGFVGSKFCSMYSEDIVSIPREERSPETKDVLYFISTTDNYNIHSDIHLDVNTNLNVFLQFLDAIKNKYKSEESVINFVSSWFVYGKNQDLPFKEDSYCNPAGFYSITKRCAEQLLICFCETFGYRYRILRLANVIGEGDRGVSKKKNALQYMIKQIVNNEDISLYSGGDIVRDYIYVEDACRAIKMCIDKGETNQIYNIGSGIPTKLIDIIKRTVDLSLSTSKINVIEPTQFHNIVQVKDAYLNTSKIKSLGFEMEYNTDDMIALLIDHYKKIK